MGKSIVLIAALLFSLFVYPGRIIARSGCCSWHGGVCGCECCDGTALSSTCAPYYPSCNNSYDSRPNCPIFSNYDSLSDQCECMYGYISNGSSCISRDQYCRNLVGFNSKYDLLSDSCKCDYGYVLSNSKCEYGNTFCRNKYGLYSSYNSSDESCECDYGYVFSNNGEECISQDDWCEEVIGSNSKYNSLSDNCECDDGYVFENESCELETIEETDNIFIPSLPKENLRPKVIDTTPSPRINSESSVKPEVILDKNKLDDSFVKSNSTSPVFFQALKNLFNKLLGFFD